MVFSKRCVKTFHAITNGSYSSGLSCLSTTTLMMFKSAIFASSDAAAHRTNRREYSVTDDAVTLNEEQLNHLARYFNEEITFSRHIGAKVEEVEPGRSIITIDVKDIHLN